MAKRELRLQYSGFAIFGSKLISVLTGFAFQFILARALLANINDSYQSNIWFNITDVIAYFTLMGAIVPFWVMRYAARGKEGSVKTGLITNTIISAIFTIAYLAAAPFILASLKITTDFLPLYLLASIQILELYAIAILESCLQAYRPQTIGYGLLLQQVGKLILGYVLIVQLGLPLLGAIVSTLVGFGIQVAYYYGLLHEESKQKIQWGYVKQWLKGSILSIYNAIGTQIATFSLIMLYGYGASADPNVIGARGYYGYATQISQIVFFASFLSWALVPKLIAEGRREDITTSLKMVLMFAIPMTIGAAAIPDSYLSLLSPQIRDAYPVLIVLAIDGLITVVSSFSWSVFLGIEKFDQEGINLKKLVKSRIFLGFSLPYLQAAISLPVSYYLLTTYAFQKPLEAALSVSIINAFVHLVSFTVLLGIMHNTIKIDVPWRNIGKYVLSASVMGIVMFLIPHSIKISTTLAITAAGAGIYLALMMVLDKEARALPFEVLREFRKKKNR